MTTLEIPLGAGIIIAFATLIVAVATYSANKFKDVIVMIKEQTVINTENSERLKNIYSKMDRFEKDLNALGGKFHNMDKQLTLLEKKERCSHDK